MQEQQDRLKQLKAPMDAYMAIGKDVAAMKADIFAANASGRAEAVAAINEKIATLVREKSQPTALQLEDIVNHLSERALTRAEEVAAEAAAEMTSVEHVGMLIGGLAALIMLGSVVFSVFTIARSSSPIRPARAAISAASVAGTIRSQVAYEVERLTGLRVASVDVHIQDVKRSA